MSAQNSSLLSASLKSARALMALQLGTRLITFVLNQALLRLASPKAYGTAAIQFELLLTTILFLSREGTRNALLRAWPQSAAVPATLANLALVPLFLGIPLSMVSAYGYYHVSTLETRSQPHFAFAVALYALAATTELLSEPLHIRAMGELRTGIRVRAEGFGVVGKALTTLLILISDARRSSVSEGEWGLLAFAIGQLTYSVILLATYVAQYGSVSYKLQSPPASSANSGAAVKTSTPQSKIEGGYFDPTLIWLSFAMTSQSLVKHVLTEGDKFFVSWASPLQDQGGYAVAVNYGSLIARIVFQPMEETARVFFSKTLSSVSPPREALSSAATTLLSLLSIQSHATLILLALAPPYLPLALQFLLPPRYLHTSAPAILSAWIYYIPVLAVNGGLEAFVSSVSTPSDLVRQSWWMSFFTIFYIASAFVLHTVLEEGDKALVYANIVNLCARIVFCVHFSTRYFAKHGASDVLDWRVVIVPRLSVIAAAVGSALACRWSAVQLDVYTVLEEKGRSAVVAIPVIEHVALGCVLGVVYLAAWWFTTARYYALPSRKQKRD